MDINIDTLIEQGRVIRQGLKYLNPPSNVWRSYAVYKLKDAAQYHSWASTCFRFLNINYSNDPCIKQFNNATEAFEKSNNHFCPEPLEKMIGILEGCKVLPQGLDNSQLESKMQNDIESAERAYSIYQSYTPDEMNSKECIGAYHNWYSVSLALFSKFFTIGDVNMVKFQGVDNNGNGYSLLDNFHEIQSSYYVMLNKIKQGNIQALEQMSKNGIFKKPCLFISHSSGDEYFVEHFVALLQTLGFNKNNLFCSSVEGFGIDEGEDIYDSLRSKFQNANIYVVFVLSKKYYSSPACMNEMGAAWVLQSEYSTIITHKFSISEIKGAINPNKMSIVIDDDKHVRSALNKFKERIITLFDFEDIDDDIVWENNRNKFLSAVQNINAI